jgi:phosphonate transport system substrate-binding protein
VFSGSLCAPLKKRIRAAMLDDQQGLSGFLRSQDASGIVPVSHKQYESLLRIMRPGLR